MKAAILAAAAPVAAVASAHEARSPLQLGLNVGNLVNVDLCLGLDVKLPLGISLETDDCPTSPPPAGSTNVWHPAHRVAMDGCDNNSEGGWHWVHPCNTCASSVPPHTWTTSTITQTRVNTVIECPPQATNCAGRTTVETTVVIPASTTICPVPVQPTTLTTVPVTKVVSTQSQQPPVATPCTTSDVPASWAGVPTVTVSPAGSSSVPPPPPMATASASGGPGHAGKNPTCPGPGCPGNPNHPTKPGNSTTLPPVMAGASTNGRKVAVAAAAGLVVALLL